MAFKVFRGPFSTDNLSRVDTYVSLSPRDGDASPPAVNLRFRLPAGGQGISAVELSFEPDDFAQVAQAMMNVNPDSAAKAFGAALQKGDTSRDEVAFYNSINETGS